MVDLALSGRLWPVRAAATAALLSGGSRALIVSRLGSVCPLASIFKKKDILYWIKARKRHTIDILSSFYKIRLVELRKASQRTECGLGRATNSMISNGTGRLGGKCKGRGLS